MEIRIGMDNPREILRALGYKYRRFKNDMIRRDANGRFHAKLIENKACIHYDVDVDGKHVASIPLPVHMRRELARVQSYVDKKRLRNGRNI